MRQDADLDHALPRTPLMRSLSREWRRLRRSSDAVARARTWVTDVPHVGRLLEQLTDLEELVEASGRAQAHGDDVMRELVRLARQDELAGRIALAGVAPIAVSRAVRFGCCDRREGVVDVVVPAVWLAITGFDLGRRPASIASALAADAVYLAFRRDHRRTGRRESPVPLSAVDEIAAPPSQPTALEELATVVASARAAGVDDEHLDMIAAVAGADSITELASAHKVTTRTIRNRRRRAVAHVRAAVAA
ncbi:MAG: hypothetical protein AAGA42_12990 [Actinomycetota bacterium]